MYTRVTVPLDGTSLAEAALAPAAAVAGRQHAPVRVVSVRPSGSSHVDLESYHQALDRDGVLEPRWSAEILVDDGQGIARTIRRGMGGPDELLCLATHAHGALGSLVLGSVAEGLLADESSPVLLVGPRFDADRPVALSTMVVCLDGSPKAEAIIPWATTWATELGMSMTLLQVAPPPTPPEAEIPPGRERSAEERDWEDLANRIAYLEQVAATVPAEVHVTWDIARHDSPATGICTFASQLPGAIVAIATRGNTGLRRIEEGSVALRVANQSAVPVLVVRSPATGRQPAEAASR